MKRYELSYEWIGIWAFNKNIPTVFDTLDDSETDKPINIQTYDCIVSQLIAEYMIKKKDKRFI